MQHLTDGTRSEVGQSTLAQSQFQQFEGPGSALILLPVGIAMDFLQDALPLLAGVGWLASSTGSNEKGCVRTGNTDRNKTDSSILAVTCLGIYALTIRALPTTCA